METALKKSTEKCVLMYIQSSDPAYIAKIKASIENAYLLCHEFDTKYGHFAKTGSGQTERKHSKKKDVFFAGEHRLRKVPRWHRGE